MAAIIEFTCPHCQGTIRTNARYAGMQGPCPHCKKPVKVESPVGEGFEPLSPRETSVSATTEANTLVAGLAACVATALFYIVFFALRGTYVGNLFTDRGPIPFITTFVTCWGLAILVLKYIAVNQQVRYAEHEMDFVPLEKGMHISADNVDTFLQHLDGLPAKAHDSILGRRIRGALEHFRARHSVPEVQAYLGSHAEIDASTVDAGYTLVRAFIWAVPILGFIGTVLGISGAVSGLAGSLDSAQPQPANVATASASPDGGETQGDLGQNMITAMGTVTQGLATAFDTTFLALVMAIILLFPTEALKRIEYGMLDRITGFTNDILLRRLSDEGTKDRMMPEIARLIEPAFRRHQQWLMEWQTQVSQLGNIIGKDFEKHAQSIRGQLAELGNAKFDNTREAVEALGCAIESSNHVLAQFQDVTDRLGNNVQNSLAGAQLLHEQLTANTAQMASLAEGMAAIASQAAAGDGAEQLHQAAQSLNQAANQLAEAVNRDNGGRTRPPRGLFGMLRRS